MHMLPVPLPRLIIDETRKLRRDGPCRRETQRISTSYSRPAARDRQGRDKPCASRVNMHAWRGRDRRSPARGIEIIDKDQIEYPKPCHLTRAKLAKRQNSQPAPARAHAHGEVLLELNKGVRRCLPRARIGRAAADVRSFRPYGGQWK